MRTLVRISFVKYLTAVLFLAVATQSFADWLYYGSHSPQGEATVDYIYGNDGTWRNMTNIDYTYNYYSQWATQSHPYNLSALISEAATYNRTCRDANGWLLLDFNGDNEIDTNNGGYAFHEHNAKGSGGSTIGNPFYQFWFDDNWLARYMSDAYGRTSPNGLWEPNGFMRWSVMDGNTAHFSPYGSNTYLDQLALDAFYYIGSNQISTAVSKWDRMKTVSNPTWDSSNQRYDYNIPETYKLGMFLALSGHLMSNSSVNATKQQEILQHFMSQRSLLISRQESSGGTLLSWRSDITQANSLINTESTSCGALGLGADAEQSYEAGFSPMYYYTNCSFFMRPYTALSAVSGLSSAGYMAYGPYRPLPDTGYYEAQFMLRAPSPTGNMAYIDVYDATAASVLASKTVTSSDFASNNEWSKLSLTFNYTNTSHNMEYRIYWYGTANMDAAAIRVR